MPGERIRRWVELGLLVPTETAHGLHHFDFRQAAWARSLCDFIQAGITPRRIRHSLEQLRRWLPGVDETLAQLSVLEGNGYLQVRAHEGGLFEPTGQGLFDFEEDASPATVPVACGSSTAEQCFEAACEHEEAGRLPEAASAYRQALLLGGPDREASFNLANVLCALGRKDQAAERYRQVLELDADLVEAWNNLGNVLAELGEYDDAIAALERALQCDPHFADAHYNLADALEQSGRALEAEEHWRAYLDHDAAGPWANYARRRLRASR